ncbi:MAG: hypothetical protein ACOVVK_18625 [Elsteraceae bacterium]
MSLFDHPNFLRAVLFVDAAACVTTGGLLSAAAGPLAGWTHLSPDLLRLAGVSLFPIAAFILAVAWRARPPAAGAWLVIIGNVGWVIASLGLFAVEGISPSGFGYGFVIAQAALVAAFAALECIGLARIARPLSALST